MGLLQVCAVDDEAAHETANREAATESARPFASKENKRAGSALSQCAAAVLFWDAFTGIRRANLPDRKIHRILRTAVAHRVRAHLKRLRHHGPAPHGFFSIGFRERCPMWTDVIDYLFGCVHTFGFPMTRRSTQLTYQTCTKCGAQFQYDWASMTRKQRVISASQPNMPTVMRESEAKMNAA